MVKTGFIFCRSKKFVTETCNLCFDFFSDLKICKLFVKKLKFCAKLVCNSF